MSVQARYFVSLLLAFLVMFGQSGFAMVKLTCLCLDQTAWSFHIPDKNCPFELENAQQVSCSSEKSCCAQASSCSENSPECNDDCLIIDLSWLKADFESSSIPFVNADETQQTRHFNADINPLLISGISECSDAGLSYIPDGLRYAHNPSLHSRSFLGQWLC